MKIYRPHLQRPAAAAQQHPLLLQAAVRPPAVLRPAARPLLVPLQVDR